EEDVKDPEDDPTDYPTDRDDDDDDEDKDEDEEEEEEEEVESLLVLTTPPPSPLTPLSSSLPCIPSPPFPASPPASPIRPTDRPEITLPPRKRLGIDLGPRYEIGESSAAVATRPIGGRRTDYGFVDDPWRGAGHIGYLCCDRGYSRQGDPDISECWDIEVSYMTRSEILALRSVVMGQQAVISQLQADDCKRLQTQMAEFQRQLGPAKGLAQPDAPGEAGSSS
ncbi:hypothetical protein Tco_1496946, partial [Tanacetum coccineum]